ncbi:MAG: GAF domain-containing sensor histidine kinase [Deltaproteobacteria bacterium]|nr:GAF domain-containing sensor histidine kinase [Deltaproteobacteria bacterium]
MKTWVGLLIRSLEGDRDTFFKDEERVGYYRAVQGFPISFSHQIYVTFQQVLGEILQQEATQEKVDLGSLWGEIQELNEILAHGSNIVATSFLKTREELITEKVTYLQAIYDFTREIISIFDPQEIINLVLRKIILFFGVEESLILLYRDQRIHGIYTYPSLKETPAIRMIMEKALKEGTPIFMDEGNEVHCEIARSQLKRVVAVPIPAHGHCYGVLALHNSHKGFKFLDKELNLLFQFLYIMAVALENAFMLEEIGKSRQELRLLTRKMITIQEEERRHLAADIHDTLAQALTGINYKIEYCKELVKINPALLTEQLNGLTQTLHQAIDQTKEIMTSLRPDLIDTIGLIPALRRHIDNFNRETGIRVASLFPKKIQIPSELSICLFRIAQEALMNAFKHADTKDVAISLSKEDGNLTLTVEDHGQGFDMSQVAPGISGLHTLGLLSMKERVKAVGGTLSIQAEIHRGCRLEAKVPIHRGKSKCPR